MKTNMNIYLLLIGRATSILGNGIYRIALPLYILQVSGSLTQMGLYFAIINVPALILSFYTGIFVEKHNRKHLLVCCDALSGCLYFILALLLSNTSSQMGLLVLTGMVLEIFNSVFSISTSVIFTELNHANTLEKMNGLKSIIDNLAGLISPMIGTFLFAFFGFRFIIVFTGCLYLISALQETFLKYQMKPIEKDNTSSVFYQIKEGIQYVLHKKDIFHLMILVMCLNFFVANAEEIINPGIIIQKYHISESLFGLASSFFIIGTILSGFYLFMRKQKHSFTLPILFIINSVIMISIGIFSFLCYPNFNFFYILLFMEIISGVFTVLVNVPLSAYFQTNVSLAYQGRFFALLSFSSSFMIPIGIAYTGYLSDLIGADIAYILNNLCVIMIVVYIYYSKKNNIHRHM